MIIFDGIIFSLSSRLGGINIYFRELLREAAASGEDMQLLVHDASSDASRFGIRPEHIAFRPARSLERLRSPLGVSRGIFHSSYYRTVPRAGIKNIVTVYDFTYEKFSRGAPRLLHSWQKRNALRRADAALCISENTRRDLLERVPEFAPEKAFVTHLAASDEFAPLQDANTAITSRPFVLFVGGRGGYKNFSAAVRAVSLLPDFALICVGGGPFTAEEGAMLERLLPERYVHGGPVGTAELNVLYNTAVCLLYPSLYEGFGIPPLEAMKAGCPFVALDRSSLPEVAGDAGILLADSEPESLRDAIEECMRAARRSELRARGFAQAMKFSWEKTYAQTSAVYRQLSAAQVA